MKSYVTSAAILASVAFVLAGPVASRAQNSEPGTIKESEAPSPLSSMMPAASRPTSAELLKSLKKQPVPAGSGTGPAIYWQFGAPTGLSRQDGLEYAILAGGCFWCLEAVYELVPGVKDVISGYTGGSFPMPNYHAVSTGTTGHAEAVLILFDPREIRYSELLEIFWHIHDPTTKNRQGYDIGPQYRSAIFWLNDAQ
ncbi:MAG: peptide-methionine (S)-S-oxide reductase MsrA, partial [Rectinema sp.]|nr:peptide-methionine (S)-S-oxide reductase MsrA [Rectinema sp.]